jgi:hypothetical protein
MCVLAIYGCGSRNLVTSQIGFTLLTSLTQSKWLLILGVHSW